MRILLFLSLIAIFACNSEQNYKAGEMPTNSDFKIINVPEKKLILNLDSLVTCYKVVRLETKNEALIGKIDYLNVYKGNIFILDRFSAKSLFVFDTSGHFKFKIHKIGKGPGECLSPHIMRIDSVKNQILIASIDFRKIMFYTLNGIFIKEKKVKFFFRDFIITPQNKFVFYLNNRRNAEGITQNIVITDSSMNILRTYFPYYPYQGSVFNVFSNFSNAINFYKTLDNNIYTIQNPDNVKIKYKINFNNKNFEFKDIPKEIYQNNVIDNKNLENYFKKQNSPCNFFNFWEASDRCMFSFTKGKFVYSAIYSKISEKTIVFNSILFGKIFACSATDVKFCFGNSFVFEKSPAIILQRKEFYEKKHPVKLDNETRDFLLNIKDIDNPVLFFIQFKKIK